MADAADVRRLALASEDVDRKSTARTSTSASAGGASCGPTPTACAGRKRVIRTDVAVLYVGDEAEKQALLLGEPGRFFTTAAYDGLPLVTPVLDQVDNDRLAELVTDAWRMRRG